tara:strand:- start:47 stop:1564 length:1518 start_codon:yes stop_codon:yes gene_type:complete
MKLYEITEAWSKKYKKSIDCSNPKGFSQKAHCAGKKKKANENHGKYYCSTDKKWKYRKGPKQSRKKVSEYEAIDENIFQAGALAAMLGMSASAMANDADVVSKMNNGIEKQIAKYDANPDPVGRHQFELDISKAALKSVYPDGGGINNRKLDELLKKYKLDAKDMKLYNNLLKLFTASNNDLPKIRAYREKTGKGGPGSINKQWSRNLEDRSAEFSAKLLLLSVLQQEERNEAESEQEVEENKVTNLKTQKGGTKEPLFSKANIQKAYSEWATGAAVDTDIQIVGKDKKLYVIRQNYDGQSQHFEEGEWYLTDANNNIVNTEGYPDPGELLYDHQADEEFYPKDPDEIDENQDQSLPPEVKEFVNRLTPSDVGVDTVGKYIIHYEGFTDQCNDGHDEESIDDVYADVYRDFDQRQGIPALVRGVANDSLGCENNPVLYSVYHNVNENFADGKKKGKSRPGRVKRSGASCKGSVTSLRAKAKKYSGERGKMYHWCANMKSGKKKSK